jgi:hypothetical protein
MVDWRTYCPITELHHYPNQGVTIFGLIVVTRPIASKMVSP